MHNTEHLPIGHKIGNHYEIIKVLGQGGFGIIYLVKDLERLDEIVVIKELFAKDFSSRNRYNYSIYNKKSSEKIFKKIKEDIKKEVNILKKINNENVVKAHGCFEENNTIYSIMEYINGEDLEKYIKKNTFDENESKELLRQLINGLKPIHTKGIIHRDIKPNNIIKTSNGIYKIIDFTTNRTYKDGAITTITAFQNPIYTPPELTQRETTIGKYSDIYSIGMTLVSLLSKYRNNLPNLTERLMDNSGFENILNKLNISEEFRDILKQMTELKPKNRFQKLEDIEKELFEKKQKEDTKIVTEIGFKEEINSSTTHSKQKDLNIDKPKSTSWIKKTFIPLLFLAVLTYGGYNNRKYISNFIKDSITHLKQIGSREFTHTNVKKFIEDFTLAEETNWAEKTLPYFSDRLTNYYGNKNISKQKIYKNKIKVNGDYLKHNYKLLSIQIIEKEDDYCKIIRRVKYKSTLKTSKVLSGVAIDSITLKKFGDTFKITSIYRIETQKDTPPKKKKPIIVSKEFNKENIESFLKEFIKAGESNSPEKLLKFYALKVNRYFNWTNTTRDEIFEDKRKFFKKWTFREYELIDFTILDKYSKDGINYCTLTNKIRWRAKSSSKSNFGVSINSIKLKSENNSFKIVSIYNLSNDIKSIPISTPTPIITLEFNYQNIQKFLKDFLRVKEGYSAENIANYFSTTVENYYGKQNLTTTDIIQRKRNWINIWKSRQFKLVNFKIIRTYFKYGIEYCDLEEIVDWRHQKSNSSEYMSGTNQIGITIKKSNNSFKITSIYTIKNTTINNFNRDNTEKFLKNFLRAKEGYSPEHMANYFSYMVKNYYGTYNTTRDYITKRKRDWIDMWKSRHFTLINFEILKTYSENGIEYCDLKESVKWRHSKNNSKIQTGISKIFMTLKKENSNFKIISIYNTD